LRLEKGSSRTRYNVKGKDFVIDNKRVWRRRRRLEKTERGCSVDLSLPGTGRNGAFRDGGRKLWAISAGEMGTIEGRGGGSAEA